MLVEARGQNDSGDSVPSEGCKSSKMHSCDAQPREAGQQAQALVQAGQGRPGGGTQARHRHRTQRLLVAALRPPSDSYQTYPL